MRWEHSLTIRMIGGMTTFGSRTYWIFSGKRGGKSVRKKRKMNWQWNCWIERNGPCTMEADIMRGILNSDMAMFGKPHEKLWRIWDYRDPMEWMIDSDRHGGSCSVYKGNGLHFSYQKCGSLDVERVEECMCVCVCLCVCPEWECPFVGRECVCHAVPLGVAECPKYVIIIMD